MQGDFLIAAAGALALGLGLIAFGLIKRRYASFYAGVPLRPCGAPVPGRAQFITGRAASPVELTSPVTKTPCAFYFERTYVYEVHVSSSRRGSARGHWSQVSARPYGAFFLEDASGRALVLPSKDSLDLSSGENEEEVGGLVAPAAGTYKRSESVIPKGAEVTVLGEPRKLSELLAYIKSDPDITLPADLLAEISRLASSPDGDNIAAFFGPYAGKVADRPHDKFVSGVSSSASLYLQLGFAAAAAGLVWLLMLLRGEPVSPSNL